MIHPLLLMTLLAAGTEAGPAPAQATGTACRVNRQADRLLVDDGQGRRWRVALGPDTRVTFEGEPYDAQELRPGDRVRVDGLALPAHLQAVQVDVRVKVAEAIVDALLQTKPRLVGRFAVREAQTEYFSLWLPGGDYIRVDAKGAYGPQGRMRASRFRSGDLLELDGTWTKDRELKASYIEILTDEEPSSCRSRARRGESREDTAVREGDEQRFLEGAPLDEAGPP